VKLSVDSSNEIVDEQREEDSIPLQTRRDIILLLFPSIFLQFIINIMTRFALKTSKPPPPFPQELCCGISKVTCSPSKLYWINKTVSIIGMWNNLYSYLRKCEIDLRCCQSLIPQKEVLSACDVRLGCLQGMSE